MITRLFMTALALLSLLPSPLLSKPGGCIRAAGEIAHKGCYSTFDIPGLGPVKLSFSGSGFAGFQPGDDYETSGIASANLRWEFNQLYVRHPMLGVVSAVVEQPQSIARLRAVDGTPPLFPADAEHELFLRIKSSSLGIEMINLQPFRFVSDSPMHSLDAINSSYTVDPPPPIPFVDPDEPSRVIATLVGSGGVHVLPAEGFRVDILDSQIRGDQVEVEFQIANLLGTPREIVWYVGTAGSFSLVSPLGDPDLLGHANLTVLGDQPLPVKVVVDAPAVTKFDCVFLGCSTLDGSRLGSAAMIDGEEILGTGLTIPALDRSGLMVLAVMLVSAALALIALGRHRVHRSNQ